MITVKDCGDYFRVTYDGIEVSNVPKHPKGFATAKELLDYLKEWGSMPGY